MISKLSAHVVLWEEGTCRAPSAQMQWCLLRHLWAAGLSVWLRSPVPAPCARASSPLETTGRPACGRTAPSARWRSSETCEHAHTSWDASDGRESVLCVMADGQHLVCDVALVTASISSSFSFFRCWICSSWSLFISRMDFLSHTLTRRARFTPKHTFVC